MKQKMKKLIPIIPLLFIGLFSYGQVVFPITQYQGTAKTVLSIASSAQPGDLGGLRAYPIIPTFADTTTANTNLYYKYYDGGLIRIDTSVYMRSGGRWVKQAGGGGSGTTVTFTTVGRVSNANAATITAGGVVQLKYISSLFPGILSTSTDSIAGLKKLGTGLKIDPNYGAIASSALLDISSTTKGILPPRMDSTQMVAIVSPVDGLEIYNTTTNTIWQYNGTLSAWQDVGRRENVFVKYPLEFGSATYPIADTIKISEGFSDSAKNRIQYGYIQATDVVNDGRYNGFAVTLMRNDTLFCQYYNGSTHVSTSPVTYKRSINGGSSWSAAINVTLNNFEAFAGLVTRSKRLIYFGTSAANTDLKVYRSRPNSEVFDSITISSRPGGINGFVFGKGKELPSGRLLVPYYNISTNNAGFITSTDDGLSWSYYGNVAASGTEIGFEIISGTNDADTKLVAIVRQLADADEPLHYYSANGGASWTLLGTVPIVGNQTTGFPADIYNDNGTFYICFGVRNGANVNIQLFKTTSAFYNNLSAYGEPDFYYQSEAVLKGAFNDWGYPSLFKWNGLMYGTFYDYQTTAQPTSGLSDTETILTIQLTGVWYASFFRLGSQSYNSIPYTKVVFSSTQTNNIGHFWQEDVVSGVHKIIIPEDGFYYATAKVLFDTTIYTGTFRRVGLQLVNQGYPINLSDEYPHSPISPFAAAPQAITPIASTTILAGLNHNFATPEVQGTFFAKKGYELVMYTNHDAATPAVSINNMQLTVLRINK